MMASYSGGDDEELTSILMIGITGVGKSATGNTILGRNEFVSQGGLYLVTRVSQVGYTEFKGRKLKVVDVPGYMDPEDKFDNDMIKIVSTALTKILTQIQCGFHAFLFVIPFRKRIHSEMEKAIRSLVNLFDEIDFQQNGILVMTHGDYFNEVYPDFSFESWIKTPENETLRWLIETCGSRCVLFDNATDDESTKQSQLMKLMEEIDKTSTTRYIPENYLFPDILDKDLEIMNQHTIEMGKLGCEIGMLKDDFYKLTMIPNLNKDEKEKKILKLISSAKQIKYKKAEDKLLHFRDILQSCKTVHMLDMNEETLKKLIVEIQCIFLEDEEKAEEMMEILFERLFSKGEGYEEPTSIVMMGMTGAGKSATGNTILDRKEFVSRGGGDSVTRVSHVGYTTFKGRKLKVVDVPGYNDTQAKSEMDRIKIVSTALTKVLIQIPCGFHAVLLVISYTQRINKELEMAIRSLVKFFDEIGFQQNGILVLTQGDTFKRENPGVKLENWMKTNENKTFRWLIETCGSRCVLFDNVTENESTIQDQVMKLMEEIDKTSTSRYIPDICLFPDFLNNDLKNMKESTIKMGNLGCKIGMLKDDLYKLTRIPNSKKDEKEKKLLKLIRSAKQIKYRKAEDKLLQFTDILKSCKTVNRLDRKKQTLNTLIAEIQRVFLEDEDGKEVMMDSWFRRLFSNVSESVSSLLCLIFFNFSP